MITNFIDVVFGKREDNYLMSTSTVNKSNFIKTTLWGMANVLSSVGLILTNKVIMGPPFNFIYVFTLTSIHFLVTALTMEIMALVHVFSRSGLTWTSSALMSTACALSVGLMNLSLRLNSLGFYQLCKLLGIPWLVVVQAIVYKMHTSCAIKISLAIILVGIALATIKHVHLNILGCIVGLSAVVVAIQFQIWQGRKQREYQLNAMQINHAQALPTFFVCAFLAIVTEFNSVDQNMSVSSHRWTLTEVKWITLSAVLAACVNLCSYGLIGNTSVITFQVVGHAKTVLILIASYFLYQEQTQLRWNNILGIAITLCGVIAYGFLRHNETAAHNLYQLFSQTILERLFRRPEDRQHLVETSLKASTNIYIPETHNLKPV
jgi:solute carrier family 35 protein E3